MSKEKLFESIKKHYARKEQEQNVETPVPAKINEPKSYVGLTASEVEAIENGTFRLSDDELAEMSDDFYNSLMSFYNKTQPRILSAIESPIKLSGVESPVKFRYSNGSSWGWYLTNNEELPEQVKEKIKREVYFHIGKCIYENALGSRYFDDHVSDLNIPNFLHSFMSSCFDKCFDKKLEKYFSKTDFLFHKKYKESQEQMRERLTSDYKTIFEIIYFPYNYENVKFREPYTLLDYSKIEDKKRQIIEKIDPVNGSWEERRMLDNIDMAIRKQFLARFGNKKTDAINNYFQTRAREMQAEYQSLKQQEEDLKTKARLSNLEIEKMIDCKEKDAEKYTININPKKKKLQREIDSLNAEQEQKHIVYQEKLSANEKESEDCIEHYIYEAGNYSVVLANLYKDLSIVYSNAAYDAMKFITEDVKNIKVEDIQSFDDKYHKVSISIKIANNSSTSQIEKERKEANQPIFR